MLLCVRRQEHTAKDLNLEGVVRPNSGRPGGCTSSTALVTFLFNAGSSAGCACACIKTRSAGVVSASACSRQRQLTSGRVTAGVLANS